MTDANFNTDLAEKLGLIPSVADWIEARSLRNSLVHEYTEDIDNCGKACYVH